MDTRSGVGSSRIHTAIRSSNSCLARRLLFPGRGLIAAGLALFATAPAGGGYAGHVLPVMLLFGTGAGICFPALMTLAMSGASPQDAGLASGLANTTAQVGGALGLAVLATVSASRTTALIARSVPAPAALTGGYHLAFWIAFGLVTTAIVVAAVGLRPQRPATPEPRPVTFEDSERLRHPASR